MRLEALERLAAMNGFMEDPKLRSRFLVESLEERIKGLPQQAASARDGRDYRLGVKSVWLAGKLEIAVGGDLDQLLSELVPRDPSPPRWDPRDDELVLTILRSLKKIGPRPETVEHMQRVYEASAAVPLGGDREATRMEARKLAVEALWHPIRVSGPSFDLTNRNQIKSFFETVLEDSEPGEARGVVIIALGDLNLEKSVPLLVKAIRQRDATGRARPGAKQAVASISRIGGSAAIDAYRDLLVELPPQSELRGEVLHYAQVLCARDELLESLEKLVFEPATEGEPEARSPWFEALLVSFDGETATNGLERLLDNEANQQIRATPAVRARWERIRRHQCEAAQARLEAGGSLPQLLQGYKWLDDLASGVLRFVDSLPDEEKGAMNAAGFQTQRDRARLRTNLLGHLEKGEYAECSKRLEALVTAGGTNGDASLFDESVQWLLREMLRGDRNAGEKELLDALILLERVTSNETTLGLIKQLQNQRERTEDPKSTGERRNSETGRRPLASPEFRSG